MAETRPSHASFERTLSMLRREYVMVQNSIKRARDAGDTGAVARLEKDAAELMTMGRWFREQLVEKGIIKP